MKPFILGINEAVAGSAYRSTDELYDLVGHNTGNIAFHHAVSNILGGSLPATSWYAKSEDINASGDIGVMPCANQLGPHANYGSVADSFKSLDTKLVAIGLGAQGGSQYESMPEVPEGTLRWLREIIDRAPGGKPNITVRGPYTQRVLEHYGLGDHSIPLGCPTLFLNPDPELGKKVEERIKYPFNRIAVAAGHQNWKHLARIEASLTRLMSATGGVYIVQSPKEMVALGRGEADRLSAEVLATCRDFATPELTAGEFKEWSRRHARAFFDVPAWMEYLRRFDLVVGLRIHGCVLALHAGVPALCIAHDSRTRELCEVMKVPFVMASEVSGGITRAALASLVKFDGAEFDRNREAIGTQFREFLENNGLQIDPVFDRVLRKRPVLQVEQDDARS